jgi:protein-S-isoprenylcysteine O-methyltransferase Ste14
LLAAHSRKAMREEALLTKEVGDEYISYRKHTGFLFPRLGGGAGMDTRTSGS